MGKLVLGLLITAAAAFAQQPTSAVGNDSFNNRCAVCHGGDGNGTLRAAGILDFVRANTDEAVSTVVLKGLPGRGMPPQPVPEGELKALVAHVRGLLAPSRGGGRAGGRGRGRGRGFRQPEVRSVSLPGGQTLQGEVVSETTFDLHLRTPDGKTHRLLRNGDAYTMPALDPKADWAHYDGGYNGSRYTTMTQINRDTVKNLALKWIYPIPGVSRLQGTPLVIDGIMYISGPNRISALDATSGRELWTFRQPLTDGVIGDAGRDANRGVAVRGDHVFMITDHAHAIAVNRWTGQKVWDTEMADYRENYSATVAPLVVGDLVIAGVSGGDEGVRGFLDAYHADTGERAWRFWTIPSREDPEAATWIGPGLEHGCGATWLSGSYDAELDLIYWPIGNPCPDMDGEGRLGDNLYTDSIVALRPKTGEMVWYYQTTPHDTHDWDAIAPLILVDEQWEGRPRKLLVQANRNGFYYVFDRTNGELLMAKPHIDELTWATGIGKDGRPITTPGWESTLEGSRVCPGLSGGANWLSASYDPQTKLMIFQDLESCAVYVRSPTDWRAGVRFFGGSSRTEPGSQKLVRAINILTGERVWQLPMAGPPRNSAGTLATAGGVVITGDNGGALMALDSKSGELLWRADFNQTLTASPMTYMVSGKQYVSIATAFGYLAFALPD